MNDNESLYKFFPYNPHDLDALSNNYLWFSEYSAFNDPFEDVYLENVLNRELGPYDEVKAIKLYKEMHRGQRPNHQIEEVLFELKVRGELEEQYNQTIRRTFEFAKSIISEHLTESRVCCFAKNHEHKQALENRLMWSHYADGLRGFCIEYDGDQLINGIYRIMGEKVGLCPMNYNTLKRQDFEELIFNTAKRLNGNSEEQGLLFGSLILTKSLEWEYENEFRLIYPKENEVSIDSNSIKSITVGAKMSQRKLNTLISILKGNSNISCPIYVAKIDPVSFEIQRELLCKEI
ncbi:DUF2971 domain-containing protein [Vibrio tubiashii]|uniref:DUF2971 domain-containing protein n=1 Tax=Vibrio tubiashii TaxID=29498 RepID=UPI00234F2EDD|nr:DUF2971 domain-containing protein [Vibrio tubiashii]WCP68501.1 DUF2971 domain-containing protein [Vibrio tubiashii]